MNTRFLERKHCIWLQRAFFTSDLWSCQKVYEALVYLLDTIFIRFGTKLYIYTEAPFLVLHLSISNEFVSSKIYDKRDEFGFDIIICPFLDGSPFYLFTGFKFSTRVSSRVADFNARNESSTEAWA